MELTFSPEFIEWMDENRGGEPRSRWLERRAGHSPALERIARPVASAETAAQQDEINAAEAPALDDRRGVNAMIDTEGRRLRSDLGLPPAEGCPDHPGEGYTVSRGQRWCKVPGCTRLYA